MTAVLAQGAMAGRIRRFNWARSPLGPLDGWPTELLAVVNLVLDNPFPQILAWGPDLVVCAYNDAYQPLLGHKPEALGRQFLEVWKEAEEVITPLLKKALAGDSMRFENASFQLFRKGFAEEAYFSYSYSPVRCNTGEIVGVLNTAIETTEQYMMQRKLHESEERYRSLTELSPDATFVTLDGRLAYANPAAVNLLAAKDKSEILNRPVLDFVDSSYYEIARERIRQVTAEGRAVPLMEYRVRRLDGTYVDAESSSSPIKWNGQQASQVVARDITHRKLVEAELREAHRRKDEFLATLAHELRNPLAPIQTGIEVLRLAKQDPRAAEDAIEMMERQMSHLVRLVDDLLDISRISRGKVTLRRKPVDVRDAITKALEATSTFTHAGNRQVFVSFPPRPLTVKADPVRLVQIIGNLLSNAGKYTGEQGKIWISGEQEGEQVKICVRDDGIGMAPEAQQHLFQLFMQVDPDRAGGLGIGLALVRSLVELHGGTVEAHSEGLGKGSEFIVRLPLFAQKAAEKPQTGTKSQLSLSGKRVLIVDDNKDAAKSLAMLLSLLGAGVSTANEGTSALKTFQEFAPDVVLLDLGMPEMDGYEVAQRIREMPEGKAVRLIAVTGWGQDEDQRRTQRAGFNGHLVKPIELKDLEGVLANPSE